MEHISFNETVSESKLISKIEKLNADRKVNGIIVQLPLPKKFNTVKVIDTIAIEKDVDGLNSKISASCSKIFPAVSSRRQRKASFHCWIFTKFRFSAKK